MNKALAVALALAAAGCARKAVISGVGPWRLDKTRLRDATGRCEPTDLPDGRKGTWCYAQPALRVGGQDASIDLYFAGTEPDAKVIEIELQFRGCDEGRLDAWLGTHFGTASETIGKRSFRKNPGAFIVADLPESPGRCTIRLLPPGESAEVDRMRTEAQAKLAPPSPAPPPPTPAP